MMSMSKKRSQVKQAIQVDDCDEIQWLFDEYPRLLKYRPIAGGSWLHYAASWRALEVAKYLIEIDFDINDPATMEGDKPISWAIHENRIEMVKFLLENGAIMDTSESVRNPLFASVTGESLESAKLLLKHGIDASITYGKNGMNATAFALLYGQQKIANEIVNHLAKGDEVYAARLLKEAKTIAEMYGPLVPIHILAIEEDLKRQDE